ncbi:hypothetical protein [Agromyces allii]|uniref:Uncharacterized protein n=1 Tax=Agromyces allii TaxID=393607 RepID=A0ABN2Q2A7_9MICO
MPVAPFVATPSWEPPRLPALAPGAPPRAVPVGSVGSAVRPGLLPASVVGRPAGVETADPIGHDLGVLGPLAAFATADVTDLFLNGSAGLWVDRGSGPEHEPSWTADEAAVRALAVRLIARGGRHIDESKL